MIYSTKVIHLYRRNDSATSLALNHGEAKLVCKWRAISEND
jgi:hypothetical protein